MHESLSQPSDQLSVLCRSFLPLSYVFSGNTCPPTLSGASHSVPLIDSSLNNWFQETLSSAFCLGFLIFISHVQAFNSFHTSPWWPFSLPVLFLLLDTHTENIAFSNCTRLESNTTNRPSAPGTVQYCTEHNKQFIGPKSILCGSNIRKRPPFNYFFPHTIHLLFYNLWF